MNAAAEIKVEEWRIDASRTGFVEGEIDMLAEILHAVVHAGAGVSFFTPFAIDEARAFWVDKVLPQMRAGIRRVLVARIGETVRAGGIRERVKGKGEEENERIVGTVQLDLEMPPNQKHRAAVAKLLVHPAARRRGIARALMMALEDVARSEKRTLLTLDTVSGSNAESLYRSLDYIAAGIIPRYARAALTPALEGTTIMYKELTPEGDTFSNVMSEPPPKRGKPPAYAGGSDNYATGSCKQNRMRSSSCSTCAPKRATSPRSFLKKGRSKLSDPFSKHGWLV